MRTQKRSSKGLNVYSNLNNRRKTNKDLRSRRRAEYLATLPKHPVKRIFYRLHPKRFWAYWFSREGLIMSAKIAGVGALLLVLFISGLFLYYRQELAAIRPGELNSRVQSTVTKYYDRNNVLLWEDRGTEDYKLVVESNAIAQKMKDATIAIEDKDFYKHGGISPTGIIRATINNIKGGDTQGASTLTQQLVKQVFFKDEAGDRGLSGIPRKIKETILAIEVERSYNKDQILTMYLNESSYGGRRNGVESAAQTYFLKSAKDLTLAEASLLASIPQQPGRFNPDPTQLADSARKDLLARQHTTLDYMVEQNKITKAEAEEAKKVPILDSVKPESDQFKDVKAPHFVQMVKGQLENELGKATVGAGGLTVKTTLDWRVQEKVDAAIEKLFSSKLPTTYDFDNGAATVIDTPTGQILGMRGSRDFNYPDYGATNAATSFIQPGSSIKPLVFASLFKQNYGSGTILSDDNIDKMYGAELRNFDNKFKGSMTIRSGLAESRNIPAVKAYFIAGRENVLNTIHDAGDASYCTNGDNTTAGPALAIGGCEVKQIEHTNAIATLARLGRYQPVATVLEVKNAEGQTIKKWKDQGKQVFDPQIAYILNEILADDKARQPSYGVRAAGLVVPGVKTSTKTGTSNMGTASKDLWMMSWSPRATMGIWVGNHVPSPMRSAMSFLVGPTVNEIMKPIHEDIFAKDGSWKADDWYTKPAGIQTIRNELYPSWYNNNKAGTFERITFDKISKKKATDCTPEAAKEIVNVSKSTDPITKKTTLLAPSGYNVNEDDDVHKCDDVKPLVSNIRYANGVISASITPGTHPLAGVSFNVNGQELQGTESNGDYSVTYASNGKFDVSVTARDNAMYSDTATKTFN